MNHAHEDRLLIVTDADGSVHNAVVEALGALRRPWNGLPGQIFGHSILMIARRDS
jgi:hypothetical protein